MKAITALGLTVCLTRTGIRCLDADDTHTMELSVRAVCRGTKKPICVDILGGPIPTHPTYLRRSRDEGSERGDFHEYTCEFFDRQTSGLILKVRMLTVESVATTNDEELSTSSWAGPIQTR